jgi:putative YphP/YqiW family bacilliredoxin
MYDEKLLRPMRDEVTRLGITPVKTASEVDAAINQPGTTFVFVNSVCGCAAGCARPGLSMAAENKVLPDRMITAFAGNDNEAVARIRSYFTGFSPSSPAFGILRDGELVWMLERWQIEGRPAVAVAGALKDAFDEYCAAEVAVA